MEWCYDTDEDEHYRSIYVAKIDTNSDKSSMVAVDISSAQNIKRNKIQKAKMYK